MFLGVEETIVGSLLFCGVSIVIGYCLFNLLKYVISYPDLLSTKLAFGFVIKKSGHKISPQC